MAATLSATSIGGAAFAKCRSFVSVDKPISLCLRQQHTVLTGMALPLPGKAVRQAGSVRSIVVQKPSSGFCTPFHANKLTFLRLWRQHTVLTVGSFATRLRQLALRAKQSLAPTLSSVLRPLSSSYLGMITKGSSLVPEPEVRVKAVLSSQRAGRAPSSGLVTV